MKQLIAVALAAGAVTALVWINGCRAEVDDPETVQVPDSTLSPMPVGVAMVRGKARATRYVEHKLIAAPSGFCAEYLEGGIKLERYELNEDRTLPHVFVEVTKIDGLPTHKRWRFETPKDEVALHQHGCRFVPHVVGIVAGQTLVVDSDDSTDHNVRWVGMRNRWANRSVLKGAKPARGVFRHAEHGSFTCDIHGWMKCEVYIIRHTLFAVTDADGSFELPKLPAGEYELVAEHENFKGQRVRVVIRVTPNETPAPVEFVFDNRHE